MFLKVCRTLITNSNDYRIVWHVIYCNWSNVLYAKSAFVWLIFGLCEALYIHKMLEGIYIWMYTVGPIIAQI